MSRGGRLDSKQQQEQDQADRSAFGITAEDLNPSGAASKNESDEYFELWLDNVEGISAYIACGTQWRWNVCEGKAIRMGLDYGGVKVVLWGLKVKNPQQVFNDIRAMEAVALEVFNAVG